MDAAEIEDWHLRSFLQHLAEERQVAAKTQNQALNAIVMFFRHGLEREVGDLHCVNRARSSKRLPTVLSADEAAKVMSALQGMSRLIAGLQLGGGLRLREALQLRLKDIDLERRIVMVREGKGDKDRSTVLPKNLVEPVRQQIETVRQAS